jgi:nucleoid DNA-binding protein
MRKPQWWALAALSGTIGVALVLAASAQSPQIQSGRHPAKPPASAKKTAAKSKKKLNQNPRFMDSGPQTLAQLLAERTKLKEKDVNKVLQALGPVFVQQLASGQQVSLPGVGTIQVITIRSHRGPVNGQYVLIPNQNTVELQPSGQLIDAANSDGAASVRTILPFQYNDYNPMPAGIDPGMRTNGMRVPSRR